MKLIYDKTGEEVMVGDKLTLAGEEVELVEIAKPRSPASTGRVYVSTADDADVGYYPGVFNMHWVDREDQVHG